MRRTDRLLLLLLVSLSWPAMAAERRDFAVAAGQLGSVLAKLAEQGGFDVGSVEPGLDRIPAPAVTGRMAPAAALRRLLADTPFRAEPVGPRGFRIVRRPPPRVALPGVARAPLSVKRAPLTVARAPMPRALAGDLVVSASKRSAGLLRFAGTARIVPLDGGRGAAVSFQDSTAAMPILQTTAFGAGRDKIFVRGIADSSFIGPTQSTASIYFGDVQLGYSGPDPDLRVYDVERIELLEGPQGTLYGAGTIGGVIRIVPHPPELDAVGASIQAGASATAHGAPGYDVAAMLNLPLADDRLGLRVVGYRIFDGGYIDDVRRGRKDVNSTGSTGLRATLRARIGEHWTVDIGGIDQKIYSPDAQYAQRSQDRLTRASAIAQPFEQDYLLARLVVSGNWSNGLQFLWATGYVDHHADDLFDATRPAHPDLPLAYATSDSNALLTQEVRLSRKLPNGDGWVVGLSLLRDLDSIDRSYGAPGAPLQIVGVTNRTTDYALFGELTRSITPSLALTGGARLTRARIDGAPVARRPRRFVGGDDMFIEGRRDVRLDPTFGLSWQLAPRAALFARYQRGFRSGGLAVAQGIGRVANFEPDTIHVAEVGTRLLHGGARSLAGAISLSYASWRHIQADLIDAQGFPFTANIGDGRVTGIEANIDWSPFDGLALNADIFLDRSRLKNPTATPPRRDLAELPDTPGVSATAAAAYSWPALGGATWRLRANARYVGHSVLGPAPLLDIRQGGYLVTDAALEWRRGALGLSLSVTNLADALGNRFALGNPFGLASRDQVTPLRPRTIRIGAAMGW